MKPILLILLIVIALLIMAGCEDVSPLPKEQGGFAGVNYVEEKNNQNENNCITNPTEIEKQSLAVKQITSEKYIKENKFSSHSEKKQTGFSSDKLRSFQAEYQVIAENNLFRPLGWQKEVIKEPIPIPKTETVIIETPQERPAPTYNLTLTGIAKNGSEWIAIIEDGTQKKGYFLHRGDKLKNSTVGEILAEHIILVAGDTEVQLSLGKTIQYDENDQLLLNTIANRSIEKNRPQPSQESETVKGGDTQTSLIERMKARRQKELGQK